MCVHFIYFQLPIDSRALAVFHSPSFVGSSTLFSMYLYNLYIDPSHETRHVEQWELPWSAVVMRAFLFHIAPLIFHILDMVDNQLELSRAYNVFSVKAVIIWSVVSITGVGCIFGMTFPEADEMIQVPDITTNEFLRGKSLVYFLSLTTTVLVLNSLIVARPATTTATAAAALGDKKNK